MSDVLFFFVRSFENIKMKKKKTAIKHKGIRLKKCGDIHRFMQMWLHIHSVHLLTCTSLRLQTDLLHTHERGGGLGGRRRRRRWRGGAAHCSALSTRSSSSPVMPAAASPSAATGLAVIDLLFLLLEQYRKHGSWLTAQNEKERALIQPHPHMHHFHCWCIK